MAKRLSVFLLAFAFTLAGCHNFQELPEGLAYAGTPQPAHSVEFLADLTWVDASGERHVKQEIFDEILAVIGAAKKFLLLDMFLYNDFLGSVQEPMRPLSQQLTDALLAQQQRHPEMEVIVITDPINNVYGGLPSPQLQQLRNAGIQVVITRLEALRDSNPVYSFFWRLFIKPFGTSSANTLPNPFGDGRVSIRSDLSLLNFKANHRKIVVADSPHGYVGIVTSANPHDGSSAHRNVGIKFSGAAVQDLYATEKAVLEFSGAFAPETALPFMQDPGTVKVQVLTERKIKDAVLDTIDTASPEDRLDLLMFYLSDRDIIEALKRARQRGVVQRILLDPNKDAFGREKGGIPNRPVAAELHKAGIPVRWCDTHGEQCHAKMLISRGSKGGRSLIMGSANYTRRNLDNLNLETNVAISGNDAPVFRDAQNYFELMWNNRAEKMMSTGYAAYASKSLLKRWLYRFMEFSGLSTF